MGRPRKPTRLKVLHGDDKKNPQRINRNEPQPSPSPIEPPYKLSKEGQEVWDRQAPDRIAKGVLTPWDVDSFAAFCEAVAVLRTATRKVRRSQKPKPGAPSPLGEFQKAVDVTAKLGGRFGWTPSDRAKLVVREESKGDGEDLLTG